MSFNVLGKPLVKQLVRIEKIRHHEIEQGPEFSHIILNGSSSQQETVSRLELLENVPSLGEDIFDRLGFVQNHKLPFQSLKSLFVCDCELIRSDHHVEGRVWTLGKFLGGEEFSDSFPLLDVTPVRKDPQGRTKLLELLLPVEKSAVRRHHEEGTPDIFRLGNMGKESYGLDSLTESHFVCEDPIDALLEKVVQPSKSLDLIFFEGSMERRRSPDQL